MMTKTDYEIVGRTIWRQMTIANKKKDGYDPILGIVEDLADNFSKRDPEFNRKKFYMCCGLEIL